MGKYQRYEKYKDSGVEVLGNIPEHWEAIKGKFIFCILSGYAPADFVFEDEGINYYQVDDLNDNSDMFLLPQSSKCIEQIKTSLISKAPFVLFPKRGAAIATNKVKIVNTDSIFDTNLMGLRTNSKSSPKFVAYVILSRGLWDIADVSTVPQINNKHINPLFFPLPPLDEQESIAHFLDRKTSQIDTLIAKKEALLEKLDEKRTALISHAVTKGLDRTVPMKDSGVEWLGNIPEHWEVKRLRFLVMMHGGSTPNKANPDFWDGEIPWISAKDLKTERLKSSVDTITDKALQETSIHIHPKNGVVIVVRGMILAHSFPVAINDIDITINQDLKVLRTSQNSEFLAILLRGFKSIVLSIMEESGHGTKVLRTDLFKNVELPHPPQVEQEKIVNYVNQKTAKIDRQKAKVKEAIALLKEYRTALITNAVTGKIDVRQVSNSFH
jgi:type I restriction enzyme, S subunit